MRQRFRDALAEIDPLEFERLLAGYFRDEGYEVDHSGTGNSTSAFDGGVDLRLRKDGRLTLVQCKRETVYQVTHNVVHELLGIKVNEGAAEAIVITSGEFTEAARRAGSNGHVRLIEGVELRRMLGERLEKLPRRRTERSSDYVPTWEPLQIVEERPLQFGRRNSRREEKPDRILIATIGAIGLLLLAFLSLVSGRPRPVAQSPDTSAVGVPHGQPVRPFRVPNPAPTEARRLRPDARATAPLEIWGPSPAPEPRQISAAEQARRDEETRRYLERVPQITHYRYSPLDQNRDPPTSTDEAQAAAPP